jgi:hypothetical protein
LIQAGLCQGSFPKIQVAEKTWKHASAAAAEAKPAFRWIGSSKKSRKYPLDRGSCAASSPAVSEKRANIPSGTTTQRYDRRGID